MIEYRRRVGETRRRFGKRVAFGVNAYLLP